MVSNPKKAMVYQQSKTALASTNLDQCTHILVLAERLNLLLTAESSLADWERKLLKNWASFQNLSIILWHNPKGDPINNTTTNAYSFILLLVQNGILNGAVSRPSSL
jgi:hypothetical protein